MARLAMLVAVVAVVCTGHVIGLADSRAQVGDRTAARAANPYAWVLDDELNPLPRYLTPAERLLPRPLPEPGERTPPTGTVRTPAEYEPAEGMLIRWGSYNSILTEMVVELTTYDPTAIAYIIVSGLSQEASARSTLTAAGADLTQVQFMTCATNTVWIRDYGPRFISDDDVRAIVDHVYNRPRPLDDVVPDFIGQQWGETVYDLPLTHGGGNFHLFSNGDAFMTELVLNENPGVTEQQVIDYFADYEGVNLTITDPFPTSADSTQHIDMWMMPVGDFKVIIGQYTYDPPRQITNQVTADLTARGYTVYRTPGWNSGGTHYTYTNAVIINNQVWVPIYNDSRDSQALSTYQQALPGYRVLGIDCTGIIGAAGAIHCIMMHVPIVSLPPVPTVRVLDPDGGETWYIGASHDIRWTATDDEGVTGIDIYLSTDGGVTFPRIIASGEPNDGVYSWTVPYRPSTQCRIKVVAHDADLNSGEDVSDADFTIAVASELAYSVDMSTNPGWTTQGAWVWGQPTGGGGDQGGPDPTSGHTGVNVYGYNLSGDYPNYLPETHLTSTPFDCSDLSDVRLRFWRWLGVEHPDYDHAYVRASNDGVNWTTVWQNTATISDTSWAVQEFDISAVADDQPTVYLRWTMGATDYSGRYCGWNIDDVELWGTPPTYPIGDLNCDGLVNAGDIPPFVLALSDRPAYELAYPGCDADALGDIDGDGAFNSGDIPGFVELLTGG